MKKIILPLILMASIFVFFSCGNDDDVKLTGEKPDALIGTWEAEYMPLVDAGGIDDLIGDDARDVTRSVKEVYNFTKEGGTHAVTYYYNYGDGTSGTKYTSFDDWRYDGKNLIMMMKLPLRDGGTRDYLWKREIGDITHEAFYVESFRDYFHRK